MYFIWNCEGWFLECVWCKIFLLLFPDNGVHGLSLEPAKYRGMFSVASHLNTSLYRAVTLPPPSTNLHTQTLRWSCHLPPLWLPTIQASYRDESTRCVYFEDFHQKRERKWFVFTISLPGFIFNTANHAVYTSGLPIEYRCILYKFALIKIIPFPQPVNGIILLLNYNSLRYSQPLGCPSLRAECFQCGSSHILSPNVNTTKMHDPCLMVATLMIIIYWRGSKVILSITWSVFFRHVIQTCDLLFPRWWLAQAGHVTWGSHDDSFSLTL